MLIIKLNAIGSTNIYLRQMSSKKVLDDYTTVVANEQSKGRGQMGSEWQSEKGKNLTCSVFKRTGMIALEESFFISIVVSIALIKTLEHFGIPKLNVKWPNDILSENKKICGILIENVVRTYKLEASIIGIGLNVNQSSFMDLPRASSLKIIKGHPIDLEEIMKYLLDNLKNYFSYLESGKHDVLMKAYSSLLFRKDKPSTFKDRLGKTFPGFIKGVTSSGQLDVLLEDDVRRLFDFKEVELLY